MSQILLDQQLLENIKRKAKMKRRADPSLSHSQWLDVLSAEHGFATFSSLRRRVEELEQEALDHAMAVENATWVKRFSAPMVWTCAPRGDVQREETWPLPVSAGSVPWPNCFSGSNLFTCGEGPRRDIDAALYTMEAPAMHFRGEELRIADDHTVLMALISAIGQYPCGSLVEFTAEDLDRAAGMPLPEWGIPVQHDAIARSLWRFVHCELTINELHFEGPLLVYADARRSPGYFAVRFNPRFANLYYPILAVLG